MTFSVIHEAWECVKWLQCHNPFLVTFLKQKMLFFSEEAGLSFLRHSVVADVFQIT